MYTTHKYLSFKTVFLTLVASVIGFSAAAGMKYYRPQSRTVSAIPITLENPAPTILLEEDPVVSQISSNESVELIMRTKNNINNTKTYTLSKVDKQKANEQVVFTKSLNGTKSVSIPYNTWSPDNKFFFIQIHQDWEDQVLVFNAAGEPFTDKEKYIDLTKLFRESGINYNFSEATGWAAQNLILLNTTNPDNTKGPSFWFEVPTRAIIQLGTRF